MSRKHRMTKHDRMEARKMKRGYYATDIDWNAIIPGDDDAPTAREDDCLNDYARWAEETARKAGV
jgi:hypothetical protein